LTYLLMLVIGLVACMPQPAYAATIVCASEDGDHRYCAADTRGGVCLTRQLSRSACIDGDSWGYDDRGIWVDRGCRAEFALGHGHGGRAARRLTCASDGHEYRHCAANTRRGIRLLRQLSRSRCEQGADWDYDHDGVWVKNGCRAEFALGEGYAADSRSGGDDDGDGLGSSALIGVSALASLALLAGAFGSDNGAAPGMQAVAPSTGRSAWVNPDTHYAAPEVPPAWLVGSFHGYNPLYDAGMLIEISADGSATAYVGIVRMAGGYRQGRLSLGGVDYTVQAEPDGMRTIQDNDPANQVIYARVP
jgi:hypothetical protein